MVQHHSSYHVDLSANNPALHYPHCDLDAILIVWTLEKSKVGSGTTPFGFGSCSTWGDPKTALHSPRHLRALAQTRDLAVSVESEVCKRGNADQESKVCKRAVGTRRGFLAMGMPTKRGNAHQESQKSEVDFNTESTKISDDKNQSNTSDSSVHLRSPQVRSDERLPRFKLLTSDFEQGGDRT